MNVISEKDGGSPQTRNAFCLLVSLPRLLGVTLGEYFRSAAAGDKPAQDGLARYGDLTIANYLTEVVNAAEPSRGRGTTIKDSYRFLTKLHCPEARHLEILYMAYVAEKDASRNEEQAA